MKLEAWEPDLASLLLRIREKELDLQPDFQRGIAWNRAKQQRLVDTVLRGWSIPPLHLLVLPDKRLAVLDGQQRLRSLDEFVNKSLTIGRFQPYDDSLSRLSGLLFRDLDEGWQRHVRNFKIPCYRLYEYEPDEPHELFFRLNLPTGLTQAEKRNALVGTAREQVKSLVKRAVGSHWNTETIGFQNGRLAYDDILARVCSIVEAGSLRLSLSSQDLETQYRKKGGFGDRTIETVESAIDRLSGAIVGPSIRVRLNKATLTTWLLAACRMELDPALNACDIANMIDWIETGRAFSRRTDEGGLIWQQALSRELAAYFDLYNDRASLRVTDVLSIVARDAMVWRLGSDVESTIARAPSTGRLLEHLSSLEQDPDGLERRVLALFDRPDVWGSLP